MRPKAGLVLVHHITLTEAEDETISKQQHLSLQILAIGEDDSLLLHVPRNNPTDEARVVNVATP